MVSLAKIALFFVLNQINAAEATAAAPTPAVQAAFGLPQAAQFLAGKDGSIEVQGDQVLVRRKGQVVGYFRCPDGFSVSVVEATANDKKYTVLTISQRPGAIRKADQPIVETPPGGKPRVLASTSVVPNLFTHIANFHMEAYKTRLDPDTYKTVRLERDLLDGVSSTIVIFDSNDLRNIHGLIRFVRRGTDPKTSMLDVEFGIKEKGLPPLEAIPVTLGAHHDVPVAKGDYVEIKSYVVNSDDKVDFAALLLRMAAEQGLFNIGHREIEIDGKKYPWISDTMVIEADPIRARLYQRPPYNFTLDSERSTDTLKVLSADVDGFIERIRKDPRFNTPAILNFVNAPARVGWNYVYVPSHSQLEQIREEHDLRPLFTNLESPNERIPVYRAIEAETEGNNAKAYPKGREQRKVWAQTTFSPFSWFRSIKKPEEAITIKGFADPRLDPDPEFESRVQLYEHILKDPVAYRGEIPGAIAFGLENREDHPQFDRLLAYLLTPAGAEHLYAFFGVSPTAPAEENSDDAEARGAALLLQREIYKAFHESPPKDEAAIAYLREAQIDFAAGQILAKRPTLEPADFQLILTSTVFFSSSARDALKALLRNRSAAKEIETGNAESPLFQWLDEGFRKRFLPEGRNIAQELIDRTKLLKKVDTYAEKKVAAEELRDLAKLAEELNKVLRAMKGVTPNFHDFILSKYSELVRSYRQALLHYNEFKKLEQWNRDAATSLRAASAPAPCRDGTVKLGEQLELVGQP